MNRIKNKLKIKYYLIKIIILLLLLLFFIAELFFNVIACSIAYLQINIVKIIKFKLKVYKMVEKLYYLIFEEISADITESAVY